MGRADDRRPLERRGAVIATAVGDSAGAYLCLDGTLS